MPSMQDISGYSALLIEEETVIHAPIEFCFQAVLDEVGPEGESPEGKKIPRVLEAWPGGRWYRDLGESTGHFWGNVQVIKPPTLLEICGPLFMSYPAMNHVQYRLVAEGVNTRLKIIHKGFGEIYEMHKQGITLGWKHAAGNIKKIAEKK